MQLFDGRSDHAFVLLGPAKDALLASGWLQKQSLLAHNAEFEIGFLAAAGVVPEQPVDCTMHMAMLVYGPAVRSLAAAAERVLGEAPPKTSGASFWDVERPEELRPGQSAYAACDAVLTWAIGDDLRPRIMRGRLRDAYLLRRDALPAVAGLRARGWKLDVAGHNQRIAKCEEELGVLNDSYPDLDGGRTAPSTPREKRELIKRVVPPGQLAAWSLTEITRELSTTRAALKRLADDPRVAAVLEISFRKTLIKSQFGKGLPRFVNPATGRLNSGYICDGAVTGRFTCKQPNIQQIPKEQRAPGIRRSFVAKPGCQLIVGDWSMIELRIFAELSGCAPMRAAFAAGRDLHRETASAISGVPYDQVSKAQRDRAKPFNFGAIFGMGPATLVEYAFDLYEIVISENEAAQALDLFFRKFPGARQWMNWHAERCQQRGFVEVVSGRRIAASWIGGAFDYTQTCNFPVQGGAAEVTLRTIKLADDRLSGTLVGIVHDELVHEVPENLAEEATQVLGGTMVEGFVHFFPDAPVTGLVTAGIGANWQEAKDDAERRSSVEPQL
jgi:DNA polymerase-1